MSLLTFNFLVMAKVRSLIKVEGTLDDLTFYRGTDGYLVRTKGGVSKNRIMNDPAFARTRENGTEFSSIAGSGKLLRSALGPMLFKAKDSKMTSRLVGVMGQLKNMDTVSARGLRNVAEGLNNPLAASVLEGFDFNARATYSSILNASATVDEVTGKISIGDFNPTRQLRGADGATHFSLQAGFLRIDFATGSFELMQSPEQVFPISNDVVSTSLTPSSAPTLAGTGMHVILIEFFQEINGVQYMLNNGAYNVLHLLKVS